MFLHEKHLYSATSCHDVFAPNTLLPLTAENATPQNELVYYKR